MSDHHRAPRRLIILLGLSLGLAVNSPVILAEDNRMGEVMANAMTRMMEAMGVADADTDSGSAPTAPARVMGEVMRGDLDADDWLGHFGNPLWEFGLPDQAGSFGDLFRWQSTRLEGIWEGRDGGLLIVQNHRFRLYQPGSGYVDGLIQQRGNRVALYNPATGAALPYESAQQRGRLVLRDAAGQLFLYRRLWSEPDPGQDGFEFSWDRGPGRGIGW